MMSKNKLISNFSRIPEFSSYIQCKMTKEPVEWIIRFDERTCIIKTCDSLHLKTKFIEEIPLFMQIAYYIEKNSEQTNLKAIELIKQDIEGKSYKDPNARLYNPLNNNHNFPFKGFTLFLLSVYVNNEPLTSYILKKNLSCCMQMTQYHQAIEQGESIQATQLTGLQLACKNGFFSIVKIILCTISQPKLISHLINYQAKPTGDTALMITIETIRQPLIEPINETRKKGYKILEYLVDNNVDLFQSTFTEQWNVLHRLFYNIEGVNRKVLLIEIAKAFFQYILTHYKNEGYSIIKRLILQVDKDGETPFHYICNDQSDPHLIQLLYLYSGKEGLMKIRSADSEYLEMCKKTPIQLLFQCNQGFFIETKILLLSEKPFLGESLKEQDFNPGIDDIFDV
eukprot:TRINITY_DN2151_c0_g1_i1.p1 TRINITY_DN2151_c0_g1~~TRINITY_DN2151_c0_g1_i1.p1  ORF type:complete len:397 (-),score=70.34 TRINITY_DN2151_c0_g1_i1:245-1435(-)